MSKKLHGYAQFKDHTVYDEQVYRMIKNHTSIFDRLNPRKMVGYTQRVFTMLANKEGMRKNEKLKNNDIFYH